MSNQGKIAISRVVNHYIIEGPGNEDILCEGDAIEVSLGGAWWVGGHVRYGLCSVSMPGQPYKTANFFFESGAGVVCGLCIGMIVRRVESEGLA